MSKTFDQGKDEVSKLCQYFATNRQSFLALGVKEAHIRQSLIDPFFEALGWDVRNASMIAPQYREVVPEDSLEIEGQQKAPDYTFRVGTLPKFYVEAKKCGVNINTDIAPAYQLRRYGFSANLSLSLLTDFEEFSVYDCASRPRPTDKASHGRIQYVGFSEYPDRWREIWDVFSREAVWSGGFDQYAASKRKKGTSEVDSEFLKDIEGWRDMLARNLALRNSALTADDLNAAVQKIIDRIIFLRMAEDRKLEPDRQLLALCDRPDIYARFLSGVCRKADEKYNSGLFHFHNEKGISDAPDTLTTGLTVDDKVLKPILQSLYFENGCPYHFGVLPVEILGTVYERFLGKVIRLTAGHQAKVEEKPEVRKAGGVYYTPSYIVNYIVQNTIGKQITDKSPAELAGGKTTPPFRVLDMACGSGSFLLGAYQFLLDHCLKWYQANPSSKNAKAVYQNAKGETCLTIAERKRILITHIYGVDIDRQAVETTKLSLLLKALEGESDTSLSQQMTLFQERALPNLTDNIKCGNSLIASDFSMVSEELIRVNAFDWTVQFPDAMKAGGFDAIIGNPPYGANFDKELEVYIRNRFRAVTNSRDSFIMFVEQAGDLLNAKGNFGMIIPSGWVSTPSSKKLRERFAEQFRPLSFVSLPYDVFEGAYVDTMIVTAQHLVSGKRWTDLEDTTVALVVFPIRHKIQGQNDFNTFKKAGNFVAWLDADSGTAGRQDAFTITNGWQGTTLQWDGIATENAAQTTSPDVFTQGTQPFNRIFPAVTSGKPLPPPFYTLFTRIRKNDTIYAQASQTVYVPQVVKIQWDEDVVALLASPDYYPIPPDPPEVTIYSGTNTESIVSMLQSLPELVSSAYPSDVNIRFTAEDVASDTVKIARIMRKSLSGRDNGLGCSKNGRANFPNKDPFGVAEIYVTKMRDEIRLSCSAYISLTNSAKYISTIPVQSQQYLSFIANTVIHEIGHELGLVMPKILNSNTSDMHNSSSDPFAIMRWSTPTICSVQSTSGFLWLPLEDEYLNFILPTP
jgi:type I restriction-modification system DNA methylase subunit